MDFAQKTHADGYDSANAKATLEGRRLTVSALSLHETSNLLRKSRESASNNATRDLFRQAVFDMFGGEVNVSYIPKKAIIGHVYIPAQSKIDMETDTDKRWSTVKNISTGWKYANLKVAFNPDYEP